MKIILLISLLTLCACSRNTIPSSINNYLITNHWIVNNNYTGIFDGKKLHIMKGNKEVASYKWNVEDEKIMDEYYLTDNKGRTVLTITKQ